MLDKLSKLNKERIENSNKPMPDLVYSSDPLGLINSR